MCFFKNKSKTIQLKFGVPYFDIFDYRFKDISAPTSVRGEIVFHIKNWKKFLKRNGYKEVGLDGFKESIKSAVIRYVKEFVTNAPSRYEIPVVQLERKINVLSELVKFELAKRIKAQFKVDVYAVDITIIEVDKTSSGYRQLKELTADIEAEKVLTRAELELEEIRQRSRMELEDEARTAEEKRKAIKKIVPICWITGIALVGAIIYFVAKSLI